VVSRHLVASDPRIRILPGYRSMIVPVMLHHHKQPFLTALHQAATTELRSRCPGLLGARGAIR
jgi:hypothetical protein